MEQVTKAVLDAANFHSKLTGEPVEEDFIKQIKHYGSGLFRLVVMGEIKKGKSSFINALLGVKDLVPVASDVATSTVFKIHYGKTPGYRVFFEKEAGKAPIRINIDEISSYGTEKGNPGNIKKVDFIEVIHNASLLSNGLVIIDTPGLGGLFKEHKKITWQYVPKADAVFFVTDSVESPIGLEEIEHLKTVLKITPHVYFVQTKAYAVDKEAREARRQNNLSILSNAFNVPTEHIPYFVVDSLRKFVADDEENLKKLGRSGYQELLTYVNGRLLNHKHRILAMKTVALAAPMLADIRNNISNRKAVLAANTAEQQQKAREEIQAAERELQDWQHNSLPDLRNFIYQSFAELKKECEEQCSQLRPNGKLAARLEAIINGVENKEQLQECLATISDEMPETASACMIAVREKLETGMSAILNKLYEKSGNHRTEIRIGAQSHEQTNPLNITENNYLRQAWENISEEGGGLSFWSKVGMGVLAGGAFGAKIGAVVPVVGEAVGVPIGALIGGFRVFINASQHELKQGKDVAVHAMNKSIASLYNDVMIALKELFFTVNKSVEEALIKSIRMRTEELKKATADLVERARMSATQLSAAKSNLARDEAHLRAIVKALEPWMPKSTK